MTSVVIALAATLLFATMATPGWAEPKEKEPKEKKIKPEIVFETTGGGEAIIPAKFILKAAGFAPETECGVGGDQFYFEQKSSTKIWNDGKIHIKNTLKGYFFYEMEVEPDLEKAAKHEAHLADAVAKGDEKKIAKEQAKIDKAMSTTEIVKTGKYSNKIDDKGVVDMVGDSIDPDSFPYKAKSHLKLVCDKEVLVDEKVKVDVKKDGTVKMPKVKKTPKDHKGHEHSLEP